MRTTLKNRTQLSSSLSSGEEYYIDELSEGTEAKDQRAQEERVQIALEE